MRRSSIDAAMSLAALTIGLTGPARAQAENGKPAAAAPSVTLEQLSASNNSRSATTDRSAELDMPQLARPPQAAAVTSIEISTQADGRALATAPVAGSDRCDPAEGPTQAELCRQRLEARASEYVRPQPAQITGEGRLLTLISPRTVPSGSDIGRQLGSSSGLNDPNGPAAQIAGALQDQTTAQDSATGILAMPSNAGPLPGAAPTIVVLPATK